MTRKKQARAGISDRQSGGESPPRAGGFRLLAMLFTLAFLLAFALAWAVFRPDGGLPPATDSRSAEGRPATGKRELSREAARGFLEAAEAGDFGAMRDRGEVLFSAGVRIPDSAGFFSAYLTTSFPPYTVYAFPAPSSGGKSRRVMLTLDAEDRVVSFLAEETTIVG